MLSSSTIGTGAVARRDYGRVIGIFLALHDGINSSRIAEALAIRDGLNLGIALKCPKVLIESDAKAIVRKCDDTRDPPSDIAVVIHDCLVLKYSFSSCDSGFVKRDCNRAAHCCAQKPFPMLVGAVGVIHWVQPTAPSSFVTNSTLSHPN
ncbi:hypothetical protein RHMOL_Rhmol06G0096400 [Rhododendron molle]|uniref:Uncharacterized protein n=1 Tax=Rhododendron molle TaxID=49168 RepID=A0ACC0NAI3_RHOML|nr:hypothetical protein RHMOL_Rhmol06G0096400 [Rhododendron molle]